MTQAIEQGHTVTAFVRNPENFDQTHENLQVVKGDVLDYSSIEHALQGQDAVLCVLGMPMFDKSKLRANGTKNIIRAMQKIGVKRLICQSGFGISDSYKQLPFHYKYFILPFLLRYVYADHEIQESYIKESQLDWIIVRPAALTYGIYTGSYWHGFAPTDKSLTIKISRADVADFMLKQLEDDTYLLKTPGISYSKK